MIQNPWSRLVQAGLLTGITDGLFASVQAAINGSTFTRLWQGVASVLLGKEALEGAMRGMFDKLLVHPRQITTT